MSHQNNLPPGVSERDCDGPPLPECDMCGRRHHNYGHDLCGSCDQDYEDRQRDEMFQDIPQPRENTWDRKPLAATAILIVTSFIIFCFAVYYAAIGTMYAVRAFVTKW